MDNSILLHQNQNPSPNCSATAGNGLHRRNSPPTSSIPITRSDTNNPYPTTFVQADTSSFKQVVQMLTGSAETSVRPEPGRNPVPPLKTGLRKDHKSANSKLYERRNSLKNFKINPFVSPRPGTPDILSPSILDFPSLALSPVKLLVHDPFNRVGSANHCNSSLDMVSEDKVIKEKGFYLHPSPSNTPRDSEPRLLPLFPITSPGLACSSTAADS